MEYFSPPAKFKNFRARLNEMRAKINTANKQGAGIQANKNAANAYEREMNEWHAEASRRLAALSEAGREVARILKRNGAPETMAYSNRYR